MTDGILEELRLQVGADWRDYDDVRLGFLIGRPPSVVSRMSLTV